MNWDDNSLQQLASEWREARLLYPLYAALSREFVIDAPPCLELEAPVEAPDQETVERAGEWLDRMDARMQVHQLRQFLQTTPMAGEEVVQVLLSRYLRKREKSDSDRDKVDFLLVQFFSLCSPSRLEDTDVDLLYVAQVLEPVLGEVAGPAPEWLLPLEDVLQDAHRCTRLSELLNSEILERGRQVKAGAEERYFVPIAMVAFTRFSFLMRRVFFRLMHGDLNAILDGLHDLEKRGASTVDCRRAQFSRQEPVGRLRMICQSWKVMFHAEYSSGQPLRMLVDLRSCVEEGISNAAPMQQGAAAGDES